MKSLALLLPLVALTAAQRGSIRESIPSFLVPGKCPVVDEKALWAEQKPNHSKYAGRWYEVAISKNDFQLVKQCAKSDLTYNNNGFNHITTGLDQSGNPIRREGVTYDFTTGANRETPHLSIQFEQPSFAAPYVILDTDYDNYSCIYSCTDYNGNFVSDFLFVWSRSQQLSSDYMNRCMTAFRRIGLDTGRLQTVEQSQTCDNDIEKVL